MTDPEQIRRAAVRAGIMGTHGTQVPMHKLEAFATLLLDEENEACAKAMQPMLRDMISRGQAVEIIRARRKA